MMLRLEKMDADALAQARQAAPALFAPRSVQTLQRLLAWSAFLGLTAYCLWRFEMSPLRFVNGLGELFRIVAKMLAGILAIIISDTGTLAKLYSEAIENIDRKPVDGVRSVGGGPLQAMRYGVLPQVLPMMLSSALYTFESNTRSATILGIVGAGGIGFYLSDRIRTMNWEDASFILLLILLTVYLIDSFSRWVRGSLIQGQADKRPS